MKTLKQKILEVLVVMGSVGAVQVFAADTMSANMEAHANVIRAQADYMRALAEARLNYARAEMLGAETAQEWERARSFKLLVDRQQVVLARLKFDEIDLRRKLGRFESLSRRADRLLAGDVTLDALGALLAMQAQFIPAGVVLKAMTMPAPRLYAEDFVILSEKFSTPEDFEGGNVGQLIQHLRENKLSVEPWGETHQAIVGSLAAMGQSADEALVAIQSALNALRTAMNPFDLPDRPVPPRPMTPPALG